MSANTLKLLTHYQQQLASYERVLALANDGVGVVRDGRPLEELHSVNLRKKELLDEIARRETLVATQKQEWRRLPRSGAASVELEALLARITALIELILRQEHETDRWILHGSGMQEAAPSPT